MINYFIYAKDFSGSTQGVEYYHSNGLKTLEQFKRDVKKIKEDVLSAGEPVTEFKIIYLHWGDKCYEVSEDKTITTYMLKSGNMGTEPAKIIEWIKQNCNICDPNKIKLLYIITDGLILPADANKCFSLNQDMYYEKVVFHAFNESLNRIDLSVGASFFKSSCTVYRNYDLFDDINISEPFDYDKIHVDNFHAENSHLNSYIKLKFIKTLKNDALALREIDKLKKLRNRLFVELSESVKKKVNLDTKDRNVFFREFLNTDWYKKLTSSDYDIKVQIEKSISTLINYIVSDKKSFSFDALRYDRKFDNFVEEEPIVDVNFAAEQEIEFPDIILDDDKGIPVILLTEFNLLDKIIFHTTKESVDLPASPASFSKFKSAMDCPLFLMNDPDIGESIGYFYTLNVYKQLLASTPKTEPRTRRPFHGGLVLTDTDEFDKYNDFILSATYFNFKKVDYNVGLYYFVLWKNCQNKEWMDKNVVERFKKYVMRRICSTKCKIALSSLPLDPQITVTLPTALWYCVELSSCLFKDDPQHFMHERLRMYYGQAQYMVEILNYFNYDLDSESIEKRKDLISHVMILKKIPRNKEKVYYLLQKIFKNVNGFLVSEIENPFNLHKLNYLKLNHKNMLPDDIIGERVHLNEYVHLMHFVGDLSDYSASKGSFDICEKTFRPYFTIDHEKSFYTELVKITKRVVINNDDDEEKIKITYDAIDSLEFDKILSLYKLFINCVDDSKTYPTLPEYINYIAKKKKFNGDLVTIFPSNFHLAAEDIYSRYQNVVAKVDVSTFLQVCNNYVTRYDRIKAEGIVKFNDDNEINQFISNEESKVGLKKIKCS